MLSASTVNNRSMANLYITKDLTRIGYPTTSQTYGECVTSAIVAPSSGQRVGAQNDALFGRTDDLKRIQNDVLFHQKHIK